ncbi:MAG: hypothetical protein AB7V27_18300 [Candidatus Binatia bacterium]
MADQSAASPPVARRVGSRFRVSPVWIVPLIVAAAAAWVTATRIVDRGPTITISFDTVEGIEADNTTIHYKGNRHRHRHRGAARRRSSPGRADR